MTGRLEFLLDTNILSELIRHPRGTVASRIAATGEDRVCTRIVVAAKSGSGKLSDRVELLLSAMEVLPLEPPADREYAALRHHLARQGTPIGPNDLLIAAHALTEGLTLITANTGEFSRVPALAIENWLLT